MKEKLFSKKALYIVLTAFISLFVGIMRGVVDIIPTQGVKDIALVLGYPLYFFTLLGVFKILGGIALFAPCNRIKDIAYGWFYF